MSARILHLPTQLDPAIEARMLVAQAGGTRVSRGWTIGATADICGLDQPTAEAWVDHACAIGLLDRNDATLRLAGRVRRHPLQRGQPRLRPDRLARERPARDGPRSSCRLGSRARPHPQRADRRLDGVWGGMTTEQRRPLLGTKPKQVPA